jgi:DNA-binding response OmpR family regulator
MNILVAEDDLISRKVLGAQLRKLGHTVTEAANGAEAWELLKQVSFPMVITDWMMPQLDGPGLCRKVRSRDSDTYTYIILLTAIDKRSGYVQGIEAGADDFVSKPCGTDELELRLTVAQRILSLEREAGTLAGLLPLCPGCNQIRTGEEQWQPVEGYLMRKTEAQFSHGVCPECFEKHLRPQLKAAQRGG